MIHFRKVKFGKLAILAFILFGLLRFSNSIFAEDKNTPGGMIPKLPKTPNDPILENGGVYPMWGPVCQRYTYHTTYRDKEGRAPEYVRMYFNGKWIDVAKENPSDNDYKKGVKYAYKFVPNKLGSNFFFFEASNSAGKTREGIIDSPRNGPVLFEGDFKHNEIALINVEDGKKVWKYPTGSAWISGVAISDDGKYAASLTAQNIYFFETDKSQPKWAFPTGQGEDTLGDVKGGIDISGDGNRIFASMGNRTYLFNSKSNKPVWTAEIGNNGAYSAAISKDGKYMAVGTAGSETDKNSNLVILWNEKSNQPLWKYHASGNFHEVSLSDDGSYIAGATGCPDRRAYIFSQKSNEPIVRTEMLTRDSPVDEAQISGDGSLAAFGLESDQGGIVLLNNKSKELLWRFDTPNHPSIRALNITSNGEYITGGDFRGGIYILNKNSNQPIAKWNIKGSAGAVDISDDGVKVAAGGADNKVHIFEKNASGQKAEINFEEYVGELKISANGKYVIAGTSGSTYFFETFSPNEGSVFPCATIIEPPPMSQAKAGGNIQFDGARPVGQTEKKSLFVRIADWIKNIFSLKKEKITDERKKICQPVSKACVEILCANQLWARLKRTVPKIARPETRT